MGICFLPLLVLAAPVLAAPAAPADIAEKLRPVIREAVTQREVPGMAVAVLRDGKPVYLETLGVLDLDAHPRKYLPYFQPADPRAEGITVRQVLAHVSGIPNDDNAEFNKPEFDDGALERFVRRSAARPLEFAPGEKFGYSNLGYSILGDLVAKVSGETFEGC